MEYDLTNINIRPKSNFIKTVAENIFAEDIGEWDGVILKLEHSKIYEIEKSRLKLLGFPKFFDGYLKVNMSGTPNMTNCKFLFKFVYEDGKFMTGNSVFGSILKKSMNEIYCLTKEMFELIAAINLANKTDDEYDRWNVINIAKNSSDKIKFEGLPLNENIIMLERVNIEVKENNDGSLSLEPALDNVSFQTQQKYNNRFFQNDRDGLIITQQNKNGVERYIARKKILKAYRRVKNKNIISKENVDKFYENPGSFFFDGEENQDEIPLNISSYRIMGIDKPYVGYFGSVKLGLLSEVIKPNNDCQIDFQVIQNKLKNIVDGKTMDEVDEIGKKIKKAIKDNLSSISIDNCKFEKKEFENVLKAIEKYEPKSQWLKAKQLSNKGVIKILPNDEFEIEFIENNNIKRKSLNQINLKNNLQIESLNNIKYTPKSYQIEGINWLIDLYENKYPGGILADDMGLGKTYQIIAFLNYLFYDKKINGRILIVSPTILLENWKNEIHKFVINQSRFKVKILRGGDLGYRSTTKMVNDLSYNYFEPKLFLEVEGFPSIVITTYQTLANYQWSFVENENFEFECVIYDEAHYIKNPSAQISQAARAISSRIPFSVLLSGTPIENELRDLWALFDVFDPTHFGSWKNFKKEFVDDDDKNIDEKLRQKASSYIMRRLKKEYLNELPQKVDKTHNVLLESEDESEYLNIVNSDQLALSKLHKLKAFSIHKLLVSEFKNLQLNINDFEAFSKSKKLLEILNEIKQKEEKVIIFVINRLGQDILKFGLENYFEINIDVINGSNNDQASVKRKLDSFKSKNGFNIIILSTLAAGVGLTITEANHIIHYERWWNPSKEDQASDRVYRIGQEKEVSIHYVIGKLNNGKKSIDEAIHELIDNKRKTAGFLIPPKSLTSSEIASEIMPEKLSISQQLDMLDWESFEILIKRLYHKMGYSAELTPGSWQSENGADVIAYNSDNEKIAIQCKHSQNGNIQGKEAIYQLHTEAREYYKTDNLVAVTNTSFDQGARRLAIEHNIKIVQRDELVKNFQKYNLEF